jgi:hypothetical protein
MATQFTLHCVDWNKGASQMKELRATACKIGFLSAAEAMSDETDELCAHAMVLSESGKAIGCARIKPDGQVECMVVLPAEDRKQIEQALRLAAWIQGKSTAH